VYVNKDYDQCQQESEQLCDTVSKEDETTGKTGFSWGIAASLIADIIISVGLAMQKLAHNKMAAQATGESKDVAPAHSRTSADGDACVYSLPGSNLEKRGSAEKVEGPPPASVFKMPTWWIGLFMVIGGEVGNFAAYGDPLTPASVVTAVGCVGVIANAVIATVFLKARRLRHSTLPTSRPHARTARGSGGRPTGVAPALAAPPTCTARARRSRSASATWWACAPSWSASASWWRSRRSRTPSWTPTASTSSSGSPVRSSRCASSAA